MNTEQIHNFNIDNEDIGFVKDFAYLAAVIKWSLQTKNQVKAAMEILGKIIKGEDVLIETKAKIIHTLAFRYYV